MFSSVNSRFHARQPTIDGALNIKHVRAHWDKILRPITSSKQRTVTAFLILRRYFRQNDLAVALRGLGRTERKLFTLDWLQSVELRCHVHAELNKGEACNALAKAVFVIPAHGEVLPHVFGHWPKTAALGLRPSEAMS